MAILELFSKRKKRLAGEISDVYTYEDIPNILRVQIIHIWRDAFGDFSSYGDMGKENIKEIHDSLCREYGIFRLSEIRSDYFDSLANFLLQTKEYEKALDVIELTTLVIDNIVRKNRYPNFATARVSPDDAISEINARFKENGVGYQYESGRLIRIDSTLIHSEIVKPVLLLLSGDDYVGANEEFLKAHEHYRKCAYKECMNECLKAFESTMKAICSKRKWKHDSSDSAKKLIELCLKNNLIPEFLDSEFSAIRSILESGVPTARNKLSGHGQGTRQIIVSQQFASYMLHLTATNILFLVESEKRL